MPTSIRRAGTRAWLLAAIAVVAMTAAFLGTIAPAHAETPSDALAGTAGIDPGAPTGYYIWRDDNGIHLRTHGPGEHHDFTAVLHSDGVFTDVDTVRLESRDRVAVLDGGHTLVFRVHTYDAVDGVNFRVANGSRLRFRLELDGRLIPTSRIFLGAAHRHPDDSPFVWRIA